MLRMIAKSTRQSPKTSTDSRTIFRTGIIGFRSGYAFSFEVELRFSGIAVRSVSSARLAVSFVGRAGFGTGGMAAEPSGGTIGGGSKYVGGMLPDEPVPHPRCGPEPDRDDAVAIVVGTG